MKNNGFRKLNKNLLNIVIGLSIFLLFSIIYDLIVGDVNIIRIILLIMASAILLLSTALRIINIKSIERMIRGQLGN